MSDLAKKALELSERASLGPWDMAPTEHSWTVMSVGLRNPIRSQCYFDARDNAPRSAVVMDAADAAFIAFSREALPALAEEVMRLREALEATRRYIVNSHPSDHDMDAVNELSGIVHAALASKPEKG